MKAPDHVYPVAAIVVGFERGGTTLLSEIMRQHPKLDSGFEGGFLLADRVADFLSLEPYCTNMKRGWGISDAAMQDICLSDNWLEAYKKLLHHASLLRKKHGWIFDKTPKYMEVLGSVLDKLPDVPCMTLVRDPRAVLWSWAKRSGLPTDIWIENHLEQNCKRYLSYADGWRNAVSQNQASRILLIHYEQLCIDPVKETQKIFDWLGLDFDEAYLDLNESSGLPNVYGSQVSLNYLTEYEAHFPAKVCEKITDLTRSAQAWFWDAP